MQVNICRNFVVTEIHVYTLFVLVKHFIFEVLLIWAEVNVDTDLLNGVESKRGINNKSNGMYVQHYATIYFIIKYKFDPSHMLVHGKQFTSCNTLKKGLEHVNGTE